MDNQTIEYLRLAHGSFNILIMFLFMYQGLLGLKIRRQRKTGSQMRIKTIQRHRKNGPVLAIMGVTGFFAGAILVYLDHGRLFKYPLHFLIGLTIALSIIATFFVSKKIKGPDSPWRNVHFRLGVIILSIYTVQAFLGIGILF